MGRGLAQCGPVARAAGEAVGKPREKMVDVVEMLEVGGGVAPAAGAYTRSHFGSK